MIGSVQPPPPEPLWFYIRDGKRFGPTDQTGLQVMADCRHLLPECQVFPDASAAPGIAAGIEALVFPIEPPPLPRTDARYRTLYRSSDERVLLGICAGIAHKWRVPVVTIRAAAVLLLPLMIGWVYLLGVFWPPLPTKLRESPGGVGSPELAG
jgi:phage shock protein PspC (stress-responsive transcriptional regulator)